MTCNSNFGHLFIEVIGNKKYIYLIYPNVCNALTLPDENISCGTSHLNYLSPLVFKTLNSLQKSFIVCLILKQTTRSFFVVVVVAAYETVSV